jgi:Tfp pilus assembly protein PilF
VPFFALSLVFGIVNIIAQKSGGAVNDLAESYSIINRLFLPTAAISSYVARLFAPVGLSAMHYFPAANTGALPWYYYLSLPFVAGMVWLILRKNPLKKEIVFGSLFFITTISVMLQIMAVGAAITCERYTYVSYIGLFYIIGQFIAQAPPKYKTQIYSVMGTMVLVFSILTWQRIGVWKDTNTICSDVIEKNEGTEPNADLYFMHYLRGNYKAAEGDKKGAVQDYTKAIALNPKFESAYANRGHLYDEAGDIKSAFADYNKAIEVNPKAPTPYNNRGWAFFVMGDTKAAIQDFDKAIALKPDYAEAYNNRGWVHYNLHNAQAAMSDYDKAVAINPDFDKPRYNRATLKATIGDHAGVIADMDIMLQMHPEDNWLYYQRGMARFNLKNTAGACADWKKSAELGNKDASAMLQQNCR